LTERADRIRQRFEVPVLAAALAVVPVIFIEENATSSGLLAVAEWANWAIWAVFFAEFTTVLLLTDRRWAYTKRAWLDVFIIISSFPLLPTLLAGTRLVRLTRLVRVFRLTRLLAVMTRAGVAGKAIFGARGVGYVVLLVLLVALGIGGAFAILEGTDPVDGLWWAIVTVTTVGYGDFFPVTPLGRAVAVVLMFLGISLVAVITASVAAYFVGDASDQEEELMDQMRQISARLDEIESLLRKSGGAQSEVE
jgi:voltage-gated potassium channel